MLSLDSVVRSHGTYSGTARAARQRSDKRRLIARHPGASSQKESQRGQR